LRKFLTVWVFAFGFFAILASISYVLAPFDGGLGHAISCVLWPGIGLYSLFNGSLLFGGGFGRVGSFVVVALGAAAAWASLAALLLPVVVFAVRARQKQPG
jgi:hypothetical protein